MINYIYLKFEFKRIISLPLYILIYKLIIKLTSFFIFIILSPFAIALHFMGFRRVPVFADRIGHLALEPDVLIKMERLNLIQPRKWIIAVHPSRVSNSHLLDYWRKYFLIINTPTASFFINSIARFGVMSQKVNEFMMNDGPQKSYEVFKLWGSRNPILSISELDKIFLKDLRMKLGIPDDAWFVCIHARESGYSTVDSGLHDYRNTSIENMELAIAEIVEMGGYIIRIGDRTMKPLKPMKHVIDFAHSKYKSDAADVVICASAKFIIGNTSGISLVGTIFGVPCLATNMVPMSTLWFTKADICMPKLLFDKSSKSFLNIKNIINKGLMNANYSEIYHHNNVALIENSPEDIYFATKEMLYSLKILKTKPYVDKILEDKFRLCLDKNNFGDHSIARISSTFLQKHKDVLGLNN